MGNLCPTRYKALKGRRITSMTDDLALWQVCPARVPREGDVGAGHNTEQYHKHNVVYAGVSAANIDHLSGRRCSRWLGSIPVKESVKIVYICHHMSCGYRLHRANSEPGGTRPRSASRRRRGTAKIL